MALQPGAVLQQYRLTRKIGEGGMGVVWQATDTTLDRQVAVKILPQRLVDDSDRLARFEREAKAVASLSHPNILAIHDFGRHEGRAFAVMELLEGQDLRERLAESSLPIRKALDHATQIARGLAAAHERGVVHRDLKPENVFVTRDGVVKILDFGLAKVGGAGDAREATVTPTRTQFTEPGSVMGTVAYMSPEQARGEAADHRADIFSFGVLLYEMLAGRRPFDRETAAETMTAILREEPPDLAVNPAVARVVQHCMEKRPEERFQSARDLIFALEAAEGGSQPATTPPGAVTASRVGRRIPVGAAAGLVVLGLLAGATAGLWMGRSSQAPPSQPAFKRLTFARGSIQAARFSADGSTVVYSARWRDRPAELFSISAAGTESLALGLEGIALALSSSGELAILRNARLSTGEWTGMLSRAPLGSSAPRDVVNRVVRADWSADGQRLVVLRAENYLTYVESPPGEVLLESQKLARLLRASPAGEAIAVWVPKTLGTNLGDILLVDLDGDVRTLTECSCTGLAWTPDAGEIWFSESGPGGETSLVAVSLSGRRREIWRTADRIEIQDIAPDGRVLATFHDQRAGVLGLTPASREEQDLSWLDGTQAAGMSDDGRLLLFNEVGPGGGPDGAFYLRRLDDPGPAVKLGDGIAVDLSPDGKFALAFVPDVRGEFRIVPIGAGQPKTVDISPVDSVWAWFVPGRDEILINGREPGKAWRFYLVDPDGGEPRPVSPEGVDHYRGQKVLSPDGRLAAGIIGASPDVEAVVTSLESGQIVSRPELQSGEIMLRWNADGRSMFVYNRDSLPAEVRRLDLQTGARTPVHALMPADPAGIQSIETLALTQDGRYYAYNYARRLDALYVIEGLDR